LQVNNWNEYRKARVLEKEILTEIKNTIVLNSQLLKNHIEVVENLNHTSDKVITLIDDDGQYLSSFETDFYFSFYSGTNIYLSTDGYEGLKNAGFEIIRNGSLRKAIVHLLGVRYQQNSEFLDYIKDHFQNYEPFLIQNFITEEKRLIPIDFPDLKKNPQFIAIIKRMKERRNGILGNLERSLEENEIVLDLIILELNQ
jgi:hypothetical protein